MTCLNCSPALMTFASKRAIKQRSPHFASKGNWRGATKVDYTDTTLFLNQKFCGSKTANILSTISTGELEQYKDIHLQQKSLT